MRAAVAPPAKTKSLQNTGDTSLDFDFGRNRSPDEDHYLSFRAPSGLDLKPRDVDVLLPAPLKEAETQHVFPTRNKHLSYAVIIDKRGNIEIDFCFDPVSKRQVKPGRYVGVLSIEATRAEPVTIPISTSTGDTRQWLAWVLASVGLLLGIVIKMLGDLAKDENATISWVAIKRCMNRFSFLFQLFGGATLMALAVWRLYYNASTFGHAESDWVTLAVTNFVAVVSGISITAFTSLGENRQIVKTGS